MVRTAMSLVVFASVSTALAQPERLAVPDSGEVEKADKLVRDLYKAEYVKKKAGDQLEAARKMLKAAGETNDNPSAKFVLYREAGEFACRAGDLGVALEAAAGTIQHFKVNPIHVQTGVLESAERGRAVPLRVVAEAAMEVADDAVRADDFASATKVLKLAAGAASRASLTTLGTAVSARMREVEAVEQIHTQLAPDRRKLESNADDPGANFKVGKFIAVMKGDWDAALPMLAMASDEKWKTAAEQEAKPPVAADARTALADRWFDLAATLEGTDAAEVRFHAYQWYSQVVNDLSGLSKTRVEKRLAEIEKAPEFRSARGAGWRVLFRSAEPSIWNTDVNRGRHQFAIPLAKAPVGLRYLRFAETVKGTSVIIEMTKERLDMNSEKDGYAWSGKNNTDFNGHHLGVSDTAWRTWPKGAITVFNEPNVAAYRGWGFGNRAYIDDVQGYAWNGEPVPRTVFEIAVKVGPLTAEESRRLLKKKK